MKDDGITLSETTAQDVAIILALYPLAFPDEDLCPLVSSLLGQDQPPLSLAAWQDGQLVGHVIFTACHVEGAQAQIALLGPLAVLPSHQQKGCGSSLVREGLARLRGEGIERVMVLGDPAYYGRFGFAADNGVKPPFPFPEKWAAAWQSLSLAYSGAANVSGRLVVPGPWNDPAWWGE